MGRPPFRVRGSRQTSQLPGNCPLNLCPGGVNGLKKSEVRQVERVVGMETNDDVTEVEQQQHVL